MIRICLAKWSSLSFCCFPVRCHWTVLFPTQGDLDRERFSTDLRRTVDRDTAYMADLRIFVSKGQTCFCSFGAGQAASSLIVSNSTFFSMTQICVCRAVMDFLSQGLTLGMSPWQPWTTLRPKLWSLLTPEVWMRPEASPYRWSNC